MTNVAVELSFTKRVTNYVVGVDQGGQERWFDVRRYPEYRVEGDRLTVVIDAKTWSKKFAGVGKQPTVKPKADKKTRTCRMCRKEFEADKWQFVCDTCHTSAAWREGISPFDF